MDNVQEDMKTKISFPTTCDQHTKQHRVKTSGSSLIVMMEDRKDGLDKSKTWCLHGLWPSKHRSDSELFVFVSVSCCLLLFLTIPLRMQCCLHRVLRFYPCFPLNVVIDCFIILDKVFLTQPNLLFHDCSSYFYVLAITKTQQALHSTADYNIPIIAV